MKKKIKADEYSKWDKNLYKSTPLEALDHLRKGVQYINQDESPAFISQYEEDIDIVENTLEQQDSVIKTLKEVIEFAQVLPHIEPNKDNGFDVMTAVEINIQRDITNRERKLLRQWVLKECFPKELKALESIKEKLGIDLSYCEETKQYLIIIGGLVAYPLKNEDEYDLLKEVLL